MIRGALRNRRREILVQRSRPALGHIETFPDEGFTDIRIGICTGTRQERSRFHPKVKAASHGENRIGGEPSGTNATSQGWEAELSGEGQMMMICEDCGSRSVIVEQPVREGADVVCAECGLFHGTYPQFFARFLEPRRCDDRARAQADRAGPVSLVPILT
jgi:hypothetical protein